MNLLCLTPQLPYPHRQGTALRNWGLIHGLAARHSVSLVSFVEPGQNIEPPLAELCQRIWTAPVPERTGAGRLKTLLFTPHADMARRLASAEFGRALAAALASQAPFDVVQVEGIELAPYLPQVAAALRPQGGLVVYDAHNAETPLQRRAYATDRLSPQRWPGALYSFIQARRLARFEAWALRQAGLVLCVSPEDRACLKSLASNCEPVLIPNGINLAEHDKSQILNPTTEPRTPNPSPQLLFTGKMDYRPNVDAALWFAEEIFPRIQAVQPEAQFVVAGQKPHPRLARLAGRPGLVVTGAVPNLRPYLELATVYVAPLRMGGGTRFKLLEAMAHRKAIVSTRFGAEGFQVAHGRELLLADGPADFAAAVLALLADETKRAALGEAARRFVEQGYDWSRIVPKLEAAYLAARPAED